MNIQYIPKCYFFLSATFLYEGNMIYFDNASYEYNNTETLTFKMIAFRLKWR